MRAAERSAEPLMSKKALQKTTGSPLQLPAAPQISHPAAVPPDRPGAAQKGVLPHAASSRSTMPGSQALRDGQGYSGLRGAPLSLSPLRAVGPRSGPRLTKPVRRPPAALPSAPSDLLDFAGPLDQLVPLGDGSAIASHLDPRSATLPRPPPLTRQTLPGEERGTSGVP